MPDWLKNSVKWILSGAVFILVGFLAGWWFKPSEKETVSVPVIIRDSTAIAQRDEDYREAQEEIGWLKKLLGTKKRADSPVIQYGPIERPLTFEFHADSVKDVKYYTNPYDMILYGTVFSDEISFYTTNPYLEVIGSDSRKIYTWKRRAGNFYFTIRESRSPRAEAIILSWQRDLVNFKGWWVSARVEYPLEAHFNLGAEVRFLDALSVSPYLSTRPGMGVEVRLGL